MRLEDNKSCSSSSSSSSSASASDEEVVLLDAKAVSSDDEDGDDIHFVLAIAVAADGSGEYSGTEDAKRLRRKRAQQKAAAATAAAAAKLGLTLVEAVEVVAVGPEATTEAAGAVEEVDADVSDVPDDISVSPTELMGANDDNEGGDGEGAAPQPALALALAQPALTLALAQPVLAPIDAAEAAVRQAEAEGLTLQPSDNATGYRGVYSDACSRHKVKPFKASFRKAGKNVHLGSFATAEEAALAYARTPEAQAAAARAPKAVQATTARGRPKPVPRTAEVAVATQAGGKKVKTLPLAVAANQPANQRPGWLGQPATHAPPAHVPAGLLQLQEKRAAPLDDWADDWKLPAKKRRHALSPNTSPDPSPAYARAPGAQAQMQAPAQAQEQAKVEVTEPVEETEPVPLTAEEQATAEGLALEPSRNASGYKGVLVADEHKGVSRGSKAKLFKARVQRAGKQVHLGFFATAEEGALVYAKTPEAQADAANSKAAPLTAEEAVALAAAEGLTLQHNACGAGYKGVKRRLDSNSRKHEARVCRAAKQIHLGSFETAEEAALAYARTPEAQAEVAKTNASRAPRAPLTVDEVVAQATSEGLRLEPSNTSTSGYKGVSINNGTHHQQGKRFEVRVHRSGKKVFLGSYATAEEAALAFARAPKV